jgi:hypothetical protein
VAHSAGSNDINIRSPSFLLARTVGMCNHCRTPTPLFALAVPPGHEALELDDDMEAEEPASYAWRLADHHAFLFHVEFLPIALQSRLKQLTKSGRFGFGDGATSGYWGNHCEHCGLLLDDQDLYCEPEGAFLPTGESAASLIHLQTIEEAFEAAAAGYAYEPQFFDAMSRT